MATKNAPVAQWTERRASTSGPCGFDPCQGLQNVRNKLHPTMNTHSWWEEALIYVDRSLRNDVNHQTLHFVAEQLSPVETIILEQAGTRSQRWI